MEESGRRRRPGFLSTGSISLPYGDSQNEESWLSLSKLRQPLAESPRGCRDRSCTTRERNSIPLTTCMGPEAHSFQNRHRIAVIGQHFDFGPRRRRRGDTRWAHPTYRTFCCFRSPSGWSFAMATIDEESMPSSFRTGLHLQLTCSLLTFYFPPSGKVVLTAKSVTTVCVSVTLAYICTLQRHCRFSSRPLQ